MTSEGEALRSRNYLYSEDFMNLPIAMNSLFESYMDFIVILMQLTPAQLYL